MLEQKTQAKLACALRIRYCLRVLRHDFSICRIIDCPFGTDIERTVRAASNILLTKFERRGVVMAFFCDIGIIRC